MAAGFDAPLTHLAATSGTLCDPATHFGTVRLGAGLVGADCASGKIRKVVYRWSNGNYRP